MKMEAVSSSEVLVLTYQTIQCRASADNNLNLYCLKTLKFCIIFLLQIDYGHPSQPNFPRSTGKWWFHCNEEGVKENETSSAPPTSTIVTDTTAISTIDSTITGTDENVTFTIPSTSAMDNGTTAISTIDSNITSTDENVTSTIPCTIAMDNGTTAISTVDSNITSTDENVTSAIPATSQMDNGTTAISTIDSNITGTDENVTSAIPTTSTTEETPPPAGRELDYDMNYMIHTGIH